MNLFKNVLFLSSIFSTFFAIFARLPNAGYATDLIYFACFPTSLLSMIICWQANGRVLKIICVNRVSQLVNALFIFAATVDIYNNGLFQSFVKWKYIISLS